MNVKLYFKPVLVHYIHIGAILFCAVRNDRRGFRDFNFSLRAIIAAHFAAHFSLQVL